MADTLTKSERSKRMSLIKGKDTKPEMVVRRMVHAMGYRYRLHYKDLPGKPDLVFPKLKKVIFVHGCFWHGHFFEGCKVSRMPKSRLDFWQPKLERNYARDKANREALAELGWDVLVLWECELQELENLTSKISRFLGVYPHANHPIPNPINTP